MSAAILAYIPVLHQGYLDFFQRHPEAKNLYLVGESFTQSVESFQKDIRALPTEQMQKAIQALNAFDNVAVMETTDISSKIASHDSLIMPNEVIMHDIAKQLGRGNENLPIAFDTVFLRWDKNKILEQTPVSSAQPGSVMDIADSLKNHSADWWRQVGAVVVKNGEVLLQTHNQHVPTPLEPYYHGDPRADFHKGELIELSTAMHAEANIIAQAARDGIALAQSDLYVTTFPCPVCAKLIAYSGIKRVYYQDGYAMLDGESILTSQGVEIVKVENE